MLICTLQSTDGPVPLEELGLVTHIAGRKAGPMYTLPGVAAPLEHGDG